MAVAAAHRKKAPIAGVNGAAHIATHSVFVENDISTCVEVLMIDLHCDTVYSLWKSGSDETLLHNSLSVDARKMREGGVTAQCFALFVPMHDHVPENHGGKTPWRILLELYKRFRKEIHESGGVFRQARSTDDLLRNERDGVLSAILTTEEGGLLEGRIERLEAIKEMGVKIFSLTWNYENELGYPNSTDPSVMNKGLKELGFETVEELDRLGILVDVSHLSDGGFWDVARVSRQLGRPFVATHSDARAITPQTRNLTDPMLRELADCGGVAGLNFCPAFLSSPDEASGELLRQAPTGDGPIPPSMISRIEDMVRHVLHVRNVAGCECLALGTDFDGIGGVLEIDTSAKLPLLRDALHDAGMSESELDRMWKGNAMRMFRAMERPF